ncbi:MAG: pyruvate ferredoxin oxidoreductase [Candidatus Lokiarchaeota archaeon]|nr:pyruvate ferredoxin oxidoreductase [Candidatus Lokiarchaeota archaeon]
MTEEAAVRIKDMIEKDQILSSGHRMCAGCAAPTVVKLMGMALRGPTVVCEATGCLEVATTIYPYTAWEIPWIHVAFENASAVASGVAEAYKVMHQKGRFEHEHVDVVAIGGDGGTFDIGFGSLSGMLERGHDIVYMVYDNGAYQNTGIQRSGATLPGQETTTSWAGKVEPGKQQRKKPIAEIVAAHKIPYVATVTPYHHRDFINKFRKALEVEGPAFIHAYSPCPRGWRSDTAKSMELAKLAVETGIHPLYEIIDGEEYIMSGPSKRLKELTPVDDYMKPQGQFRHLFKDPQWEDFRKQIQTWIKEDWELLKKKCGVE